MNSKNKNDIIIFAKDIYNNIGYSSVRVQALFISEIIVCKLMLTNTIFDNYITILKHIFTYDRLVIIISKMLLLQKEQIDNIFESFLYHLLHGNNKDDVSDAGGFSQIELYMIQSIYKKYKEE